MKLDMRRTEGVIIFQLDGKIVDTDSLKLKKMVDEYIASSHEAPKLLLDLSGVSMMDSSGLGTLIGAHLSIRRKGGRMGVINVGTNIRNLLVMAKLTTVLEHLDSEAEAIESFRSD